MEGGTTFHFVTEGIEVALKKALAAAKGLDVRVGGGANVIKQYLRAGLLDELHLVMTSKLLGAGERLFEGTDEISKTYECAEYIPSETVTHVRLVKRR
jgi:dihydrofolate reductase